MFTNFLAIVSFAVLVVNSSAATPREAAELADFVKTTEQLQGEWYSQYQDDRSLGLEPPFVFTFKADGTLLVAVNEASQPTVNYRLDAPGQLVISDEDRGDRPPTEARVDQGVLFLKMSGGPPEQPTVLMTFTRSRDGREFDDSAVKSDVAIEEVELGEWAQRFSAGLMEWAEAHDGQLPKRLGLLFTEADLELPSDPNDSLWLFPPLTAEAMQKLKSDPADADLVIAFDYVEVWQGVDLAILPADTILVHQRMGKGTEKLWVVRADGGLDQMQMIDLVMEMGEQEESKKK